MLYKEIFFISNPSWSSVIEVRPDWAVANVVGSYALGFAGVLVGREVVRLFAGGGQ